MTYSVNKITNRTGLQAPDHITALHSLHPLCLDSHITQKLESGKKITFFFALYSGPLFLLSI